MANSYHMEALRKQRLLDRKNEALRRLEKQGTDLTKDAVMDGYLSKQTPKESPLITDEGQFNQQRSVLSWIGKERNRRQYDHSRDGPILPNTWTSLKKELQFREATTSLFGASAVRMKFNCSS
ncbi:uncharacterized protein LOC124118971 isoform X4 [Haliotis rufescens]|uniref:uncharacterized protein LOC124118971 isoform X4 n=1 Tax=Haliotis rufescens TaxID=6454 RepID=UPI001EB09B67|nr:uncharacterized protein LOC124118971 isoform X4 [Haliotis rufescens]